MEIKHERNKELISLVEWNKYFSYPSYGYLRQIISNADKNGFNKVIRRIGKRIYLKVDAFFEWVDEQNGITKNNDEGTANV